MRRRDLGRRREQVLAMVPTCRVLADIGAGDGHLSVELVRRRRARQVIATEIAEGARAVVEAYVCRCALADSIEVRSGAGLSPLAVGEAEVIVIAGMGALTIRDILQGAPALLAASRHLILQPLNDPAPLRRWLWEEQLGVTGEELVEQGGRYYPVLMVQPGMPSLPLYEGLGDLNFELGIYLLQVGHPHLGKVLGKLERQCTSVLADLKNVPANQGHQQYWQERQQRLKEARRCWQERVP